jgi:hypothetical protein
MKTCLSILIQKVLFVGSLKTVTEAFWDLGKYGLSVEGLKLKKNECVRNALGWAIALGWG